MYRTSAVRKSEYSFHFTDCPAERDFGYHGRQRGSDWPDLREQLLAQWGRLSKVELEMTGYDRLEIARLVQRKYGVPAKLVEAYLFNLERALPVLL